MTAPKRRRPGSGWDVGRVDVQLGVQVSGQRIAGGQLGGDSAGSGRGKALGLVQGGQLGQLVFRDSSEFTFFLRDLRSLAVSLAGH
jgi:hypothetical protein